MNLVWCMAVALFAATSAEPVNSTPPAAAAAHAPAVLPVMQSVVRHAASADLKEFDRSGYSFKSDIAEMASGKYPVGFVGGKARLAKDSKKLEFFGILNNDEVILVLDNFDTSSFGSPDTKNFLKFKVGDQDVELQFFKNGDRVQTDIKFGSNDPISAHVTLKNNGKLRVHLTRNGIKIDGQLSDADLSVKTPWSVVKTSSGKEAVKVTIDASGMREASFDLQLETPFGESAEVALLAGLKVWHWGLIGLAIAVIVGGFVLFVCSRWEKCPLHKKMCFKNKGQAVKDKEEAMPEEGTQPEQKHLTEETKADKPPVKREVSVSRDQPSRVSRDAVSSHQATLKVATTQWNYQDRKEADEGGYENLDPAEDEGKQKKASEKPKRDDEKLTKPMAKGPEIVYMKENKKPVKDGKESAEGKNMEKAAGAVEPDKPMIAPKSDGFGNEKEMSETSMQASSKILAPMNAVSFNCWVPPMDSEEETRKESNLKASAPVVEKETKKIDEKKAKRRKSPVQEGKRIEKRRKKERRLAESDSYRSSRREESQRRVNSVRLKVDAVHRDDMLRNNVKPPEKPRKKKTRGSTPRKRTTRSFNSSKKQ